MITFVLGGARSGKSRFALEKASACKGKKIYIATAQAIDDEMKERIKKHKEERSGEWSAKKHGGVLNMTGSCLKKQRTADVCIAEKRLKKAG